MILNPNSITCAEVHRVVLALAAQAERRREAAEEVISADDPDGAIKDDLRRGAVIFDYCANVLAIHAAELP